LSLRLKKTIGFWILFFLINFAPVSGIIPFGAVVAERYIYFSSAGFAGICGCFFAGLLSSGSRYVFGEKGWYRKPVIISILLILCCYQILLVVRAVDWKNDEALWTATLRRSPREYTTKSTFYVNLGNVYFARNDFDTALKYYFIARKIDPDNPGVYNNIGIIFMKKKYYDLAKSEFIQAIEMNDTFLDPYFSLCSLYIERNELAKAEIMMKKVMAIDPYSILPFIL